MTDVSLGGIMTRRKIAAIVLSLSATGGITAGAVASVAATAAPGVVASSPAYLLHG
jgi:hypothetical protein